MQKQKNKKTIPLIIVLTLLIVSSLWTFRNKILLENNSSVDKRITTPIPNKKTKPVVITYTDRMNEARKLMDNEYYSEATLELSEAIKLKPNYIEPYLVLGDIYLRENSTEKLNNLINKLEKTFPESSDVLVLKTRKNINERKFSEIMSSLQAIEKLPPELQFYKALLLTLQNDQKTAKKILKSLETKLSEIKINQDIRKNHQDKQTSEALYRDFSKKVTDAHIVYEEFEDFKEGRNAHLFAKFAKVLTEDHEIILAQEFASQSIKEDPQYIDAWVLRGYSLFIQKDYASAIKDFREAYKLDPIRPEVHYFMALALVEEGYLDEAALFFEKALEHDFEFSEEVQWKLIDILTKQGKYDEVLDLYKFLLNTETDPQKFSSAVHTAIDVAHKPNVALEFTQILIKNNPNDIFAMNIYSWALIANNRYKEAEKILNKAKQKDPKNPRTFLNLGLLYEEINNDTKAAKMYQESYQLGKNQKNMTSLVNLAADKYNELTMKSKSGTLSPTNRLKNSP